MSTRSFCLSVGFMLTLCSVATFAQDKGPYLGAGVGQSKAKNFGGPSSCPKLPGVTVTSCSVLDDTDTGWKVFGGYRVSNAAFEASWVDLGKVKLSESGTVSAIPVIDSAEAHAYGASFDAVFSLPISSDFSLSARAGLFHWTVTATVTRTSGAAQGFSEDRKLTGTGLDFGVGARYDFAENAGIRIEFQRFAGVGVEGTTGKADVDLISASLIYRFR